MRLPAGERLACGVPTRPGQMACQAIVVSGATGSAASAARAPAGYGPSSLQSAYGLTSASAHRGRGVTVAIVDAFSNPDLVSNLAAYRRHFRLPACGTRNRCLRIVNQAGRAGPLPGRDANWGLEESLDLDMVSAICPRCHILLVEARSAFSPDLGAAEDTAVRMGARFVSNSWSGGEFLGQDAYDNDFNHPGDAIVFASGDFGYGAMYPTDTQYVTAVGGTRLVHRRSGRRAWTETAWSGTGSGCSSIEAKPSWQKADDNSPRGCLNRTENDVAADADPNTGVAIYDTYQTGATFVEVGGTSVATPIITSVYALAGTPARGTYPASYLYRHTRDFHDVTAGSNGKCESNRQYLCNGKRGYDGPTGLGTPNGIAGFSSRGAMPLTLVDPGTQDVGVGTKVQLTLHGVDSDAAAKALSYRATGLPPGFTIRSGAHSLNGVITGTARALPGSFHVTVTARDARTRKTASTRFYLYVIPSMSVSSALNPGPGTVVANGEACLSAKSLSPAAGTAVVMDACDDSSVSQQWGIRSGAAPGSADSLTIGSPGVCLAVKGTSAVLQSCSRSASQQWLYLATGPSPLGVPIALLENPSSGLCLNGQTVTNSDEPVVVSTCSTAAAAAGEDFYVNNLMLLLSGRRDCMTQVEFGANAAACAASDPAEDWTLLGGVLTNANGCLVARTAFDGSLTKFEECISGANAAAYWLPGPNGELINGLSGKCLDDQGSGRALVLEDCYGQPGEVWGLN